MFIDRHPAYPLYRHWYDLTSAAPEFPAPPTTEPTPRIAEDVPVESVAPVAPATAPKVATGTFKPAQRTTKTEELPAVPPLLDPAPPLDERGDSVPRPRRKGPPWLPLGVAGILVVMVTLIAISGLLRNQANQPTATSTPPTQDNAIAAAETDAVETTGEALATSSSGFTMFTAVPVGDNTLSRALPTVSVTPTAPTDLGILTPTSVDNAANLDATAIPQPTSTPVPPTETPAPTDAPTIEPTSLPPVPAEGLKGQQSLLDVAGGLGVQADFSAEQFSRTGDAWKLGLANDPGSSTNAMMVRLPVEVLEQRFGANAAARIASVETTMALITFTPELVTQQQVYFGAGLENAADPTQNIGLQVLLAQPGIISLGPRVNGAAQFISQRSVTAVVVRIRLQRDPVSGVVTLFYNDEQIGQPALFAEPDGAIVPVLFVRGGGVIVNVTDWHVTLR